MKRLQSIDFLRGVAALAVVCNHAISYGDYSSISATWFWFFSRTMNLGHHGVELFFVISGFCIHLAWVRNFSATGETRVRFFDFWKRRLYRLYPPYFVALCISLAIIFVVMIMGKHVALTDAYPSFELRWIGYDFLMHASMLHGLHPVFDKAGGNPPFWSLAREEYLYLLYFVLIFFRMRWSILTGFFMTLVTGWIFYFFMKQLVAESSLWWGIISTSALFLWVQWSLGSVAVEAYFDKIKLSKIFYSPWFWPVWVFIAKFTETRFVPISVLFWGLSFFSLLMFCVNLEKINLWPSNFLINWFTRVGSFSYSLYLVHYPVRGILKQLLGKYANTQNPILYTMIVFFMVAVCYLAGKIFYSLVEVHFVHQKPIEVDS